MSLDAEQTPEHNLAVLRGVIWTSRARKTLVLGLLSKENHRTIVERAGVSNDSPSEVPPRARCIIKPLPDGRHPEEP